MVAKKKSDRYSSMTDVIRDFENWNKVSTSVAPTPSSAADTDVPKNVIDMIFDDDE
jgi:hypothetical protein